MKTPNAYKLQESSELPVSLLPPMPQPVLSHLHLSQVKAKCLFLFTRCTSTPAPLCSAGVPCFFHQGTLSVSVRPVA